VGKVPGNCNGKAERSVSRNEGEGKTKEKRKPRSGWGATRKKKICIFSMIRVFIKLRIGRGERKDENGKTQNRQKKG